VIKKRQGESGSPWRSLHRQRNHFPGQPLRTTADREDVKMVSIQSHHSSGKPRASIMVRRLDQLMESKALAKSSLRTMQGARQWKQVCTNSAA
jgi:hypothetical protein